MSNQSEKAKFLANVLGNLAVIGYGLAIYQQEWWALVIAIVATFIGYMVVRRIK